jgi:general stress protein CsbA
MYQWFVVLHLAGLVVFALCHGVSTFVAFRIRGCSDRSLVVELLALSQRANKFAYVGLLLLVVGGIGAAAQAGSLASSWVIATSVVLIVVLVVMGALAAGFYYPLRKQLAETTPDGSPMLDGDRLVAALDNRRPDVLAVVGLGGLLVMVALMVLKPA